MLVMQSCMPQSHPFATLGLRQASNPILDRELVLLKHPNKVLSKCINTIATILTLMKDWSEKYNLN